MVSICRGKRNNVLIPSGWGGCSWRVHIPNYKRDLWAGIMRQFGVRHSYEIFQFYVFLFSWTLKISGSEGSPSDPSAWYTRQLTASPTRASIFGLGYIVYRVWGWKPARHGTRVDVLCKTSAHLHHKISVFFIFRVQLKLLDECTPRREYYVGRCNVSTCGNGDDDAATFVVPALKAAANKFEISGIRGVQLELKQKVIPCIMLRLK